MPLALFFGPVKTDPHLIARHFDPGSSFLWLVNLPAFNRTPIQQSSQILLQLPSVFVDSIQAMARQTTPQAVIEYVPRRTRLGYLDHSSSDHPSLIAYWQASESVGRLHIWGYFPVLVSKISTLFNVNFFGRTWCLDSHSASVKQFFFSSSLLLYVHGSEMAYHFSFLLPLHLWLCT